MVVLLLVDMVNKLSEYEQIPSVVRKTEERNCLIGTFTLLGHVFFRFQTEVARVTENIRQKGREGTFFVGYVLPYYVTNVLSLS